MDLHKRVSQIAVLTDNGELTQHLLANEVPRLEKRFAQLPIPSPVAVEASVIWWCLVNLLERLGHQPVLSNPKQTKAIAAARLKNDKVDAQRLAWLLRDDLLPTVWDPASLPEAREFIRHRISPVWLRTQVKNRVQDMLARRNLRPTRGTNAAGAGAAIATAPSPGAAGHGVHAHRAAGMELGLAPPLGNWGAQCGRSPPSVIRCITRRKPW